MSLSLYKSEIISADQALDVLSKLNAGNTIIDVRSEKEYQQGHFINTTNVPILTDDHRHEVGICYKTLGQVSAIELAEQLVQPFREGMIERWADILQPLSPEQRVLFCWRGGLRSQTAVSWLQEYGTRVQLVEGGYKAIRSRLTAEFSEYPRFLVVGGLTGAGKTDLLKTFESKIDLEELAQHRGSAFGSIYTGQQPSQQTFEHGIAIELRQKKPLYLIEDESRLIGRCALPSGMYQQMSQSDCVIIEASLDERVQRIYDDYVLEGNRRNINCEILRCRFQSALDSIKARLGGVLTSLITNRMNQAFDSGYDAKELHCDWIGKLLSNYYDVQYHHSLGRMQRQIRFRGSLKESVEWIKGTYQLG